MYRPIFGLNEHKGWLNSAKIEGNGRGRVTRFN